MQPIRKDAVQQQNDLREDALNFRNGTVTVSVDVTPQRRKTPMGDLVLRGFVGDKEVEVIFPGQRQVAALPLLQRLVAKLKLLQLDPKSQSENVVGGEVRQSLKVDGAWRVRLMNEQDAKPDRRFQLVAARWRYRGPDGVEHVFGHLPNV